MTCGFGSLWLTRTDGSVSRIDPADGQELAVVNGTAPPIGLSSVDARAVDDNGRVGHGQHGGRSASGLPHRPDTNTVVATITVTDRPLSRLPAGDVSVGGGFVWVSTPEATVVKVDPRTDTVVARYGQEASVGITFSEDAVWTTDTTGRKATRLPTS